METRQKLAHFEEQVRQCAVAVFPHALVSVTERGRYRLKMRINLKDRTFIDIFYNPHNDRTDFALIHNHQRIFGYDNLGGWQRHAVEDPETHTSCTAPPIDRVFQEMKEICDLPTEDAKDHS